MKTTLSFIIGITFIFTSVKAEVEKLDAIAGDFGFKYGFLSKPTEESKDITVLSDSSIIHTGDLLRINIGYLTETHICVIYKGAEGEYLTIYDSKNDKDVGSSTDTTYATAFNWGGMGPPPGIETFYFINTASPLTELINLVNRFEKVPPKGKAKLAKRIQEKIDSLDPDVMDDLSSIVSRLDKPIAGGVSFRGDDDDGLRDQSLTHECQGTGGKAFQKIILIHH